MDRRVAQRIDDVVSDSAQVSVIPSHILSDPDEFLVWFDSRFRRLALDLFYRRRHQWSDLDCSAAWSSLLLCIWKKRVRGDDFSSYLHLHNWFLSFVRRIFRWGSVAKFSGRGFGRNGSALEHILMSPSLISCLPIDDDFVDPDAGIIDAALNDAWSAMSPKRRAAIEVCVLAQRSISDGAEILGCRSNTLCGNLKQGLQELRLRYDGKYVSRTDAVRRAKSRRPPTRGIADKPCGSSGGVRLTRKLSHVTMGSRRAV